jgi:FSR family fosmidomycin resistance protein-like MFS transporter
MNRKAVALLAIAHLFTDINQGALPALLPLLILTNHWSYATAATLVLVANSASSFLQPVLGHFADRIRAPWMVWAGMLLATCGIAMVGIAPSYGWMLAAVAIGGIGSAAFHPEAARLMTLVAGPKRATAMSLLAAGGNSGFATGPILATGITVAFGLRGTPLLVLPALILAVILSLQIRSTFRDAAANHVRAIQTREDVWGPFTWLSATIIARSVIFYGLNTFLPLYWVAVLHQSREAGGRALTLLLVSGAIGTLIGGRMSDRFGRPLIIRSATASVPFLLALLIEAPSVDLAYAALVPLGMILFAPFSAMVVLGQEYLPNRVAMASGVTMGLAGSIGGLAAPLLGSLADHHGMQAPFWVLVGLGACVFILSTKLRERTGIGEEGYSQRLETDSARTTDGTGTLA